jgi:hypothetical protein
LLLLAAAPAPAESTAEFDDAVARLQFAFYTGDSRALEEMLGELAGSAVHSSVEIMPSWLVSTAV